MPNRQPRAGDVVAVRANGHTLPGYIARWNGNPDAHARVITVHHQRKRTVYARHWLFISGLVLIDDRTLARETRETVRAHLATKAGKELLSPPRRMAPRLPDGGRGRLEAFNEPLRLADANGTPTEQLMRYVTEGSRQKAELDWLQRRHPTYYRVYVARSRQGMKHAQIAELVGKSPVAVRHMYVRAQAALAEFHSELRSA